MIITFGAYRGQDLQEVLLKEPEYIMWLASITNTPDTSVASIAEYCRELLKNASTNKIFSELCDKRKAAMLPVIAIIRRAITVVALKHGSTTMCTWLTKTLGLIKQGYIPSPRARVSIADVCGRQWGRRNSKKYKSIHAEIVAAFVEALNIHHDGDGLHDCV